MQVGEASKLPALIHSTDGTDSSWFWSHTIGHSLPRSIVCPSERSSPNPPLLTYGRIQVAKVYFGEVLIDNYCTFVFLLLFKLNTPFDACYVVHIIKLLLT